MTKIQAFKTWEAILFEEKEKPYFKSVFSKLNEEIRIGKNIYPQKKDIFNALTLCPFENTKVVILGQDPYHGEGQAHGLAFSVPNGIPAPPSLKNIFKEIANDLSCPLPKNTDLTHWAKQGVLLLNTTLTVEAGKANSHANWGWQQFTDKIIQLLNNHEKPIVFLLWGAFAIKKSLLIDNPKHCILTAPHPSPLSVYRGFFGCKHFSQANTFLIKQGRDPIEWS
jgi:uracil-DNA glycosylase